MELHCLNGILLFLKFHILRTSYLQNLLKCGVPEILSFWNVIISLMKFCYCNFHDEISFSIMVMEFFCNDINM